MTPLCRLRPVRFSPLRPQPRTVQCPSLQRTFCASRRNHAVTELLQASHWVFQEVHSVSGLSWAFSIPLTAALARLAWFPIQCKIDQNANRRAALSNILQTWRHIYRRQALARFPPTSPAAAEEAEKWVQSQLKIRQALLQKDNKVLPSGVPFLLIVSFLPVWILNADVIRRMTGDERTITNWLGLTKGTVNAEIVPQEPGFVDQGLPWVTDLVSMDPYYILPLAFGAISLANAYGATKALLNPKMKARIFETVERSTPTAMHKYLNTRYLLLNLAQAMAFAAGAFPLYLAYIGPSSALMLYLIGSASAQLVLRPLGKLAVRGSKPFTVMPMVQKAPQLNPNHHVPVRALRPAQPSTAVPQKGPQAPRSRTTTRT
ncbi:hypothetical protein B0A52_05539 [Exophiala mesophila]|uniref:Uncharacterized protein n=1 Tax=Exophiala mesophila TaxID=212818 RepID=A0A438N3J4_EXOME|nr:hypothetical protein B0A52_05539 [Exophiala mesophila]